MYSYLVSLLSQRALVKWGRLYLSKVPNGMDSSTRRSLMWCVRNLLLKVLFLRDGGNGNGNSITSSFPYCRKILWQDRQFALWSLIWIWHLPYWRFDFLLSLVIPSVLKFDFLIQFLPPKFVDCIWQYINDSVTSLKGYFNFALNHKRSFLVSIAMALIIWFMCKLERFSSFTFWLENGLLKSCVLHADYLRV